MADRNMKTDRNVPGKYYVDTSCVDCDMCRQDAPKSMRRDDETGNSYVFEQPRTLEEIEAAEEALRNCPTESIGNDG
jgi:ferredoxin